MTNIVIVKYSNLVFSLFSYMNEYLAIGSRGHLFTNSPCSLTAAWLDASQRIRDAVRLNMSDWEYSVKHFEHS